MALRPANFRIDTETDIILTKAAERLTMSRAALLRLLLRSYDAAPDDMERVMLAKVLRDLRAGRR